MLSGVVPLQERTNAARTDTSIESLIVRISFCSPIMLIFNRQGLFDPPSDNILSEQGIQIAVYNIGWDCINFILGGFWCQAPNGHTNGR